MQALTEDQFRGLNSQEMAMRMDAFFQEDHASRHPPGWPMFCEEVALPVLASAKLQSLDEAHRKRALTLLFRARFQVALASQHLAFANSNVHQGAGSEWWESPYRQTLNAASRQAQIVAARIAFESLMEFIYVVEEGDVIPAKRSKFGKFQKWVCKDGNRFGWMVFYLLVARRFDARHRTPEVHGTSYIAIEALCCGEWPFASSELEAINTMHGIWPLLVQSLNDVRPTGGQHYASDEDIFQHFHNWPTLDLGEFWKQHSGEH